MSLDDNPIIWILKELAEALPSDEERAKLYRVAEALLVMGKEDGIISSMASLSAMTESGGSGRFIAKSHEWITLLKKELYERF